MPEEATTRDRAIGFESRGAGVGPTDGLFRSLLADIDSLVRSSTEGTRRWSTRERASAQRRADLNGGKRTPGNPISSDRGRARCSQLQRCRGRARAFEGCPVHPRTPDLLPLLGHPIDPGTGVAGKPGGRAFACATNLNPPPWKTIQPPTPETTRPVPPRPVWPIAISRRQWARGRGEACCSYVGMRASPEAQKRPKSRPRHRDDGIDRMLASRWRARRRIGGGGGRT